MEQAARRTYVPMVCLIVYDNVFIADRPGGSVIRLETIRWLGRELGPW